MLCQNCGKRETCTELCPEAHGYVDKDAVKSTRESILPDGDISDVFEDSPHIEWPNITKSRLELIFLMYFEDKLTQAQVADKLGVSQPYVSGVVNKIRKEIQK